jgi:hypothetical protein
LSGFSECYEISAGSLGSNEFLFVLVVYLSLALGFPFPLFCFVVCVIFLCFMLFAYSRLDKNWFTCFVVLFATSSVLFLFGNTLRQAMAVPFILLFVSAINIKNYKEAVAFFFIAFFCHYSSLLVLLAYMMFSGVFGGIRKSVLAGAISLAFLLGTAFYFFYGAGVYNLMAEKFYYYLGGDLNFSNLISVTFISGVVFVSLVSFLRFKGVYRYDDGVLLFYVVCVFLSFVFVFNDVIYNRITLYRTIVEVIVLMRVFACFKIGWINCCLLYPVLAGFYLSANFHSSPAYNIF